MKQKNVVLMVVAVGCGLVAAFLTTQINAKPKVETVEVLVATKDLPTGTNITKENWDKLTVRKAVPKEGLSPKAVTDPADLIEKRLARSVRKDEAFNADDVKKTSIFFLEGKDILSMPINATNAAAGAVGPGSKVDVLTSLKLRSKLTVFPLLVNMHVLEVNGEADLMKNPRFPNMSNVSLAVSQEEAELIMLAESRGCRLQLLLRHPGKPQDANYSVEKVKALLESEPVVTDSTEGTTGRPKAEDPVAPTTPAGPTTVQVLVATEFIPANTELTKDLVDSKFQAVPMPKEMAAGAYGDLTPYLGKALRSGLAKGQWVTDELLGLQAPKPSPREEFALPKPDPDPKAPPTAEPVRVASETRDVNVTTASGTMVYRYAKDPHGDWKLRQVLTVDEAARKPAAAPEKTPAAPSDRKVD